MLGNLYIVIEQFSVVLCLFSLYGKKFKMDILTMCTIIINVVVLHMKQIGYLSEMASALIIVIFYIYCLYKFNKSIKLAAINCVLYLLIISFLQLICIIPMAVLKKLCDDDTVIFVVINMLVLLLVLVLQNQLKKVSDFVFNNKWLSFLPIIICLGMMLVLLFKYKSYNHLQIEIYCISVVFVVLAIVLTQKWYQSRAEIEKKQLQLDMLTIYNNAFESLVADIRRRQHDIRNHLSAIYGQHYTSKTYDELVENQREYCDYILLDARFDKLMSISIPVLGGFLYSKFNEITERGIEVEYDVEIYSKNISVPIYEIIAVLGIFIDNAVEKVLISENEKKVVKLIINESDEKISISVKNINEYIQFNDIVRMFEEGYSSKGCGRGVGLYNVKEKALKYGFDILVDNEEICEQNWINFSILINKC